MNPIQSVIFNISYYIVLLPLCIAWFKYRTEPSVLKIVAWYLLLVTLLSMAALALWYQKRNNLFLYHICNVAECTTLLLMYREILKKYVKEKDVYVYRKIFIVLIILFAVFALINAMNWQPTTTYPSYTRTTLNIIVIICSALYFYSYTYEPIPRKASELGNYISSRVTLFWVNIGLFSFYGFTLIRAIFMNVLLKELSKESYTNILTIQAVFSIMLYVCMTIGFIKTKPLKEKKPMHKQ